MNGEKLLDQQHREKAISPENEVIVRAGAGSGKTRTLQERYMKILENIRYADKIVAITFTEAAAKEILKRVVEVGIRQKIGDLYHKDKLTDAEYDKYMQYYESIKKARISTLHSFFNSILSEYATEFGYDVNLTTLTDEVKESLLDDVISQFILDYLDEARHQREQGDPTLWRYFERLLFLANSEGSLRGMIKMVFNHRYQFRRWLDFYERIKQSCGDGNELHNRLCELVNIDPAAVYEALEKTKRKKMSTFEAESYFLFQDHKDAKGNLIPSVYEAFNQFMRKMLEYYAEWKQENNYIDFNDMEERVLEELSKPENSNILDKIRSEISYILIDEFQDTSDIQWRIIELLIRKDEKLKSEPPKVFLVGDEKQSIYYFREADVSIFNQTIADFAKLRPNGEILEFVTNFRSHPAIVEFANLLFNVIFDQVNQGEAIVPLDESFKAKPMALVAGRTEDEASVKVDVPIEFIELSYEEPTNPLATADPHNKDEEKIHLVITNRKEIARKSKVEYEAEIIARRIYKLIYEEKIKPKDIAILFRATTHLKTYLNKLSKYGIKAITYKRGYFYEYETIKVLYNLLSFLNNEVDDVALVGTLRSFLFGISDRVIAEIALTPGNYMWDKFSRYVNGTGVSADLIDAYNRLKKWLGFARKSTVYSLVKTIYEDSNIDVIVQGFEDPLQEEANLQKFLEEILNFETVGYQSLGDFLRAMKERMTRGEAEEAFIKAKQADDYIQVMTIHAAKGLEFDVVIIPDLESEKMNSKDQIVFVEMLKENNFLEKQRLMALKLPAYIDVSENKAIPTYYSQVVNIRNLRESFEMRRLFYVAVTRAKRKLIFPVKMGIIDAAISAAAGLDTSQVVTRSGKSSPTASKNSNFQYFLLQALESPELISFIKDETKVRRIKDVDFLLDVMPGKTSASQRYRANTKYVTPVEKKITRMRLDVTEFIDITKCENLYLFKVLYGIAPGYAFRKLSVERKEYIGTVVHKVMEMLDSFEHLRVTKEELVEWVSRAERVLGVKLSEQEKNSAVSNLSVIFRLLEREGLLNLRGRMYKEFYVNFAIDNHTITGVIDAVIFTDSEAVIIDYKTGKRSSSYNTQINLYAWAIQEKYGFDKIRSYLLYTQDAKMERVRLERAFIETLRSRLAESVALLERGEFVAFRDDAICKTCTLRSLCKNVGVTKKA